MSTTPITPVPLDLSTFAPLDSGQASTAGKLRQSVSFGVQQNPDEYAKLLKQQQVTGMAPEVAQPLWGETQNAIDVERLNPEQMAVSHPRTAAWASNPDNAAVAGVDEIQRLSRIEQHAATMSAYTRTWRDKVTDVAQGAFEFLGGSGSLKRRVFEYPLFRVGLDALRGTEEFGGNLGSFVGIHGANGGLNALQRSARTLEPESFGSQETGLDKVAAQAGPMIPAILASGGTALLARTLGLSEAAAKVFAGLAVGGMFSAEQGGGTYTSMRESGASPYDARLAANRVAAINTPANALFGATEAVPFLRNNPLLASLGVGGATGASGQIAQNVVTGRPAMQGIGPAALQGAAAQGGMHAGMGFLDSFGAAVDEAQASKLRERAPEVFAGAMEHSFAGNESVRIPADRFTEYFKGKGIDPAAAAQELGAGNYTEAVLSGGDVEMRPESYLANLAPEHQKELFQDIVDPSTGMSTREGQAARAELEDWASGSGPENLIAEMQRADAETQASPEWQEVKDKLAKQLTDAGEKEPIAEAQATLAANAISSLAKRAGLKPAEVMALHAPEVVAGEAPVEQPPPGLADAGREGVVSVGGEPVQPRQAEPGEMIKLPVSDVGLDPKRFQFKMGTDAAGVTNLLKGRTWNPELADPVSVWRDPEDGKYYVVNGHHRLQLAKENRVESIWGKIINAPDAGEARSVGALQNIAQGRGTPMDAAKYFRESGLTPADLERRGISMGEATAAKGIALARLDPHIFDQVVSGKIREGRGVAIGDASSDPAEQEALLKLIAKAESKGSKRVSDDVVNELARMVKAAGQHTETQENLFGVQELTHSLALEKADVSSFVREKIATERRIFQGVSQESKAKELARVEGQSINAGKNAEIAQQAAQAQEVYDRISTRGGPVDDILNAAAKEVADGGNANAIKQKAYTAIRAELSKALAGSEGQSAERVSEAAQPAGAGDGEVDRGPTLFQGRVLHAGDSEQPRGWFRVLPDGRFEIGKTKIGDFSTFIHEPAHAYLELFRELTQRESASEPLKDDFKKICEWLGTTPEQAYRDGFTREQHEQWARANEAYVREGKAPTSGLQRAFHGFGVWLSKIYRRASALGVELSSDIRGVMDRLYAGDEAVDRAERETPDRLFEKPEDAGWTEQEFRNYADAKGLAVDQAKAQVMKELNEAAVRERTQAWREEKSNVRDAVTQEVDARPEYAAIRSLRRGSLDDGTALSMNRDALVKQFGEDRVKALQKLHPGLYRAEGGTDAETAAEILGYGSAEEMVRALEAAPRRAQAVDAFTRDVMTERHGDIRFDGTLDDKARLAVENDERARGLHQELSALKRRIKVLEKRAADSKAAMASITIAPLESYQAAARQMIDQKAIADIQPHRYLDASRKYSREAFDALRKGNVENAANAKHKELLNHFLFREATDAKTYVDKFERQQKQAVQSKGIQQRLALAGSDFRDQHNWLQARYGIGPSPEQGRYNQPTRGLRDWAAERFAAGEEPAIAPGIMDDARYKNYRNVPLAEIRDLHDALTNIRALARQQFEMFVQGKKIEFAAAKNAMVEAARSNLKQKPERIFEANQTRAEKVGGLVERGDALLIRMERLMEWLDGGKSGAWHDNLWNRAADAQGDEYALQHEITAKLHDAIEQMPREWRDGLTTKRRTIDGISEPITRKELLSMALNMGNDGNLDRLRKTFIHYDWDPAAIESVKRELTREDWQFVQHTWDMLVPLGERMKELEKRLTGLPPAMVQVTPLRLALADGTPMDLRGGYYPIKMDPKFSQRAIMAEAGESAQNAMDHGYVRATTSRGYTKERTGFGGPLLLDFENVLSDHAAKVVKDLTHREFMLAANRLLTDTEVRKALRETLGPAYERQMMPWLRTIINDRNGSVGQGLSDVSAMLGKLRGNLVTATLGFKVSTSLLQITHAPRMLLYTKPGTWAQAMVDFLANPRTMTQEIRDMSPNEMRFRGDNLDRDIREKLSELTDPKPVSRMMARAANVSIQYIDHMLSFPLWLSVYRDGLKEHASLPEAEARSAAMHKADSAVRLGLGSQAPKDLPAIMRSNDFNKLITMFYGFHNGIYNQVRDVGHQFRYDANWGKLTWGLTLSVLAPAILSELVRGKGPEDDENPGRWAATRALLFSMDTIPLLRDIASGLDRDGSVHLSPLENVMEKGSKALIQAGGHSENKDWTGIGLNALEAIMGVAGVPGTTQGMKVARYAHRVHQGRVEDPNVWNAVVGGGR